MIRIETIIRPEKFDEVQQALQAIGVIAMTVDEVRGCGHQAGHVEHYRGMETRVNLIPKVRITTVVHEIPVEQVIETIRKAAFTGAHGDGKIFISTLDDAVRIRTGEHGGDAV